MAGGGKLLDAESENTRGFVANSEHAVWLGGVQINAVALVQIDLFAAYEEGHAALKHIVEFLPRVRAFVNDACRRLGLDGDNEHIRFMIEKPAYQTAVVVRFRALHGNALTVPHHEVGFHVGCFREHELFGGDAVFMSDLHQVRDSDIQLALFDPLVLFLIDFDDFSDLLHRYVEYLAQTAQAFSKLFELFVHKEESVGRWKRR